MPLYAKRLVYNSAKKLSSTDWCGFDLVWQERMGTLSVKTSLEKYLAFEQVTIYHNK